MAQYDGSPAVENSVEWLLTGLATFFVAMRIASRCLPAVNTGTLSGGWARKRLTAGWYFYADDIVMFVAWIFDVLSAALISVAVSKGAGQSIDGGSRQSEVIRWINIAVPFPQDGVAFANLSIGLLLVRLFDKRNTTNTQIMRWLLPSLSVVGIVLAFLAQIFLFVQCTPISFGWDKSIPNGRCWKPVTLTDFVMFMKIYTCAVLLLYALYPIVIISKLNITLVRKIGLSCLLSAGLFVFASGIFASTLMHINTSEPSVYIRNATSIIFWDKLHCDTIIIFGCGPAIGPAVRTMKRTFQRAVRLPRFSNGKPSLEMQQEEANIGKEKIGTQTTVAKVKPNTYEGIPLTSSKCKSKLSTLLSRPLSHLQSTESRRDIDDLTLQCPQPVYIRHQIDVYETETDDTARMQPWMDPRWHN